MTTVRIFDRIEVMDRGGSVRTWPLITKHTYLAEGDFEDPNLTTGISEYPVGSGAPLHSHNCDEQVVILSGRGFVEAEGVRTDLARYDTAYVEAGKFHRYQNTGDEPMVILWIYPQAFVTRTFADTGVTVEHLTPEDAMGGRSPL